MPPIVIVGGGVVGCAAAYYLKRLGAHDEIIIVEKEDVAAHSSGKAGGFLASGWCDATRSRDLARLSFTLHEEIRDECKTELGYRGLSAADESGELLGDPTSCKQVHPRLLTRYLSKHADQILTGVEVKEVTSTAVVLSDGRSLEYSSCIVAVGPWSCVASSWFPEYDFPSRTWDEQHCSAIYTNVEFLSPSQATTAIFTDSGLEIYPRPDGSVYVCHENHGSDPHTLPPLASAMTPTQLALDKIHQIASAALPPLLSLTPSSSTACCLPLFHPKGPTIGRLKAYPNIFLGCGHSCWGILQGPATGLALAEGVLQREGRGCEAVKNEEFSPEVFRRK